MVLGTLGSSIAKALSKINSNSKIDEEAFNILLNDITKALLTADVNIQLIHELNDNIRKSVSLKDLPNTFDIRRVIDKAVIEELTNLLDSGNQPFIPKRGKSNVIMFVGLQGNGKTTTCSKLAYYYRKRGWKVGVVCADTFRAGAFDQLRMNATKIKVPYYGKRNETDPVIVASEGVKIFKEKKFEIIIVDTSGRHKQQQSLFEEMEAISNAINPNETIFVLDSTIGQTAESQAIAFKQRVDVGSVIITKLDGNAKGGGALSAVAKTGAPITFIGIGEHMDKLEKFNTKRFVQRILGRGDIETIFERAKEAKLDEDNNKFIRNLQKGTFTLKMLRDQFENLLKIGSVAQIMQMIGLNELSKQSEQASQKRVQSFLLMMDSMTNQELESTNISIIENNQCRKERICRGSGVPLQFLDELIAAYKQFSNIKLPGGKKGKLSKNPQQQINQIRGMIPDAVWQQIGGQQGLSNLFQRFQSGQGGNAMMPNNMQNMMRNINSFRKCSRKKTKFRR